MRAFGCVARSGTFSLSGSAAAGCSGCVYRRTVGHRVTADQWHAAVLVPCACACASIERRTLSGPWIWLWGRVPGPHVQPQVGVVGRWRASAPVIERLCAIVPWDGVPRRFLQVQIVMETLAGCFMVHVLQTEAALLLSDQRLGSSAALLLG